METITLTRDEAALILQALGTGFTYARSMAEALEATGELSTHPLTPVLIEDMEMNLAARSAIFRAAGEEV